jgi:glycosyltransferase involved in cell wall biosynthesis
VNYGSPSPHQAESQRLEAVTACVGFDDALDATLTLNHAHLDTMIVVTSPEDRLTQLVARKHGALCVQTDLFKKNGRNFNKGAAINAGFARFQYFGWRLHLDADIVLPDSFRRMLFNHTVLDPDCLYGADRVDVVGLAALHELRARGPQAAHSFLVHPNTAGDLGSRYVDTLRGYCPMGFFQLWNARNQQDYPWGLGTAAHDDIAFADQWPGTQRRHLPSVICYHLVARPPVMGENWDGNRRQPRLS